MMRVLMIIAPKNFRDEELLIPKEILEHAGNDVKIASLTRVNATGMLGAVVKPDFAVHEINTDYFDAVVVVGGSGSPVLAESKEVLSVVRAMAEKEKLVAAICLAPIVLAKAGILVDKDATVYKTKESVTILREGGARYVEKPLVVDDNIITADGPASAEAFGKKIVELLGKKEK